MLTISAADNVTYVFNQINSGETPDENLTTILINTDRVIRS